LKKARKNVTGKNYANLDFLFWTFYLVFCL